MRTQPASALLLALAACGSGGGSSSPVTPGQSPELLACRARVDSPHQFAEICLRSAQNLGQGRVADRTGRERNVRRAPNAQQVVFARERSLDDPNSRELFVATLDGSTPELRLTNNTSFDDEPCWAPDGSRILFASERAGTRRLWTCAADGSDARLFVEPPGGSTDGEPDWHAGTDRVAWSRRGPSGKHNLWLSFGDGSGAVPLTDGGPGSGVDSGDHQPSFAPDGSRIAFARRLATGAASLCSVEVATGTVTTLLLPSGEVALPRWAPAGDRLFFGLAEPTQGRGTLRLASLIPGGEPALLWPDARWQLDGLDCLPALGPAPAAAAPRTLDVRSAAVQIASGTVVFANRSQLVAVDDDEFTVTTVATAENREVAGINCRFDLPVVRAEDVLELRVRAVARVLRAGADCFLRMSLYNPVDERFDTVVERPAADTTARTMTFRTSSLRHVTSQRQLRVTVIGDLPAGAHSDLRIDLVEVILVARAAPL
ncbi:MAG: PD40 domain-containing protein [Planctomycetes bacterium]|nr:PD40 domain-containing protein [Planctomycetota bacterium]